MSTTPLVHQVFGVRDGVPAPLALPEGLEDPARAHDRLPLGVYEAARTFDHDRFVGLREHLDRMERSIGLAGLEGSLDRPGLCRALDGIVRGFPAPDARVRIDYLAGPAEALGSDDRLLVQAAELVLPPPEAYRDGVRCGLTSLRRARPELKEARWVVDRRAAGGGRPDNFESILVDGSGRLLEGVMSNFFWARDGVLRTAPVRGVLAGITRGIVLRLAAELGIETVEEAARAGRLERIDEAFFTTSVRSVVPVVGIEGVTLGAGRPGGLTRRLMEAYAEFCSREAVRAVDA